MGGTRTYTLEQPVVQEQRSRLAPQPTGCCPAAGFIRRDQVPDDLPGEEDLTPLGPKRVPRDALPLRQHVGRPTRQALHRQIVSTRHTTPGHLVLMPPSHRRASPRIGRLTGQPRPQPLERVVNERAVLLHREIHTCPDRGRTPAMPLGQLNKIQPLDDPGDKLLVLRLVPSPAAP